MQEEAQKLNTREKTLYTILAILVILIGAAGYIGYEFYNEYLAEKAEMQSQIEELNTQLDEKNHENQVLSEALTAEQNKINDLEEKIEDIEDVVGDLDKLSKTDPELLRKYSKVYFLNEHYVPDKLTQIDPEYVWPDKDVYLRAEVNRELEKLMEDAEDDGIELSVVSAYRSFDTQNVLKSNYSVTYGSGANRFSADQGYSEHQLGTTVDFSSPEINGVLSGFNNTEAYKWLVDNAHKYGFVLSYPENNAFYIFEPWHWRFVGKDLARDLDRKNMHFYDMEQREIDKYLIDIFD